MHDIPSKYQVIDSTWYLPQGKEPYVLPQHYHQIFFVLDLIDEKIWFVTNCEPRGKYIIHDLIN